MGNLKNKQLNREFAKPSEPEPDTRESELQNIESNQGRGWDFNKPGADTDWDRYNE